jgi:membrane associated rhomboid family serine protease
MTPAAVGFQCPECIRAGAAATRQATLPFGGRMQQTTRVVPWLIGINAAVYVLGIAAGVLGWDTNLVRQFGMQPVFIAVGGEWWRLITAAFLHGGLLHILFNMYALYLLGPAIERVLGSARFLVLYLVAALGGSAASFAFGSPASISVGASGAIFGLMGALLIVGQRFRRDVTEVLVLLGVNFAIGFVVPSIDWRAHLGGAVAGALAAAVFAYAPKQNRVLWQTLGILGVLLFIVIVVMVRTAQLQAAFAGVVG